jgi:polyisoprenoid-binding protein YceI
MTATTWNFDLSHSSVNFYVRHLMVSKVHGRFQTWGGTLIIDDADVTRSRVEVTNDVASIDTKEEKRDAHLRSADFFDAENHPKLTFVSTSVKKISDEELEVTGDLTIRGTTKPITLKVESNGTVRDPWGGTRAGFSAKASISRKEFGLHWNALLETGGVVVGDKIEIGLEIEAIQAAANKAA